MKLNIEDIFTALSHPLRLRALLLLHEEGELCVCELIHALGVSQPMISRHLAHLRKWNLVSDRRQGLWVYYRIHDELPDWALDVLTASLEGVAGESSYAEYRQALVSMPNRPSASCCA